MRTVEHVVRSDGTIHRRIVEENQVCLSRSVITDLAKDVARTVRNVGTLTREDGTKLLCSLAVGQTCLISVALPTIRLKTHFRIEREVLVPIFACPEETLPEPELDLPWVPPAGLEVVFAVNSSMASGQWLAGNCYLFVTPDRKHFHRLPLPNTHSDCQICMGDDWGNERHASLVAVLAQAITVFESAKWNTDLLSDGQSALIKRLFRFDIATMKNLPPVDNFTVAELETVATPISNLLIV